jgi:hypothetical protein
VLLNHPLCRSWLQRRFGCAAEEQLGGQHDFEFSCRHFLHSQYSHLGNVSELITLKKIFHLITRRDTEAISYRTQSGP